MNVLESSGVLMSGTPLRSAPSCSSDGTYAVLRTQWHCAAPVQALSVEY